MTESDIHLKIRYPQEKAPGRYHWEVKSYRNGKLLGRWSGIDTKLINANADVQNLKDRYDGAKTEEVLS